MNEPYIFELLDMLIYAAQIYVLDIIIVSGFMSGECKELWHFELTVVSADPHPSKSE